MCLIDDIAHETFEEKVDHAAEYSGDDYRLFTPPVGQEEHVDVHPEAIAQFGNGEAG